MSLVLVQHGIRHASYSDSGMLISTWRRDKKQKPDYVETLGVFTLASFEYDVDMVDPKAHEETDGWPPRRSGASQPQKRTRPRAEDLI